MATADAGAFGADGPPQGPEGTGDSDPRPGGPPAGAAVPGGGLNTGGDTRGDGMPREAGGGAAPGEGAPGDPAGGTSGGTAASGEGAVGEGAPRAPAAGAAAPGDLATDPAAASGAAPGDPALTDQARRDAGPGGDAPHSIGSGGDARRDAGPGGDALRDAAPGEAGPPGGVPPREGPPRDLVPWDAQALDHLDQSLDELLRGEAPRGDAPREDPPRAESREDPRRDGAPRDGAPRDGAPRDDADRGERVHALVAEGRFAEAHVLVGDAFVERNGSAGYLLRAWILTQEGRPAQAREAVDWALALAGPAEAADVFVLAGVVLLSLDETHAALTVALRASGADPDGWEPSVLLSDVYRRLGRLPDAVSAARRAVALAPHEAEAQVALVRSLSVGRGLLGRVPRRHRAEYGRAVERALVLGAEPAQLSVPRGGALAGGVAVTLLWGLQLYRIESGGRFQLMAGAVALLATFAVVTVVVRAGTRRSGTGARARLSAVRATTRTELVGDPWLWRIGAARVAAWLPVPVLLTTGLAADRGWRGRPWPLWATAPAAAVGLAGALLVVSGAYWWYGRMFAARMLRYGGVAGVQLALGVVLASGTVALSARERVTAAAWAELALCHAVWSAGSWIVALGTAARLRGLRGRDL